MLFRSLCHKPECYIWSFKDYNIDLMVSGHTHGGQIRLPFIGPIIAPGRGLFPKYDKGIIEIEDTILYIDSGLGNRLVPIRLFNRVQISNIMIGSD